MIGAALEDSTVSDPAVSDLAVSDLVMRDPVRMNAMGRRPHPRFAI
jgi:hypothetical protein